MKMITQDRLKEMLSYDESTGNFIWIKYPYRLTQLVGKIAGSNKGRGYIRIVIDKQKHYAHRLAWLYVYGSLPELTIDHIDGNTSNNRIENLRCVTHKQNMMNVKKHSSNTSGFTGVTFSKSKLKWVAQIGVDGKGKFLGCFYSKIDAAIARIEANSKYGFHENHGR
jgi:hypothetical protein